MANELDSMFEAYAKKAETEKSSQKKGGFERNYESIKYIGLEPNVPKVVRFVGPLYGTGIDQYTARKVTIAKIYGDDGKRFRVIRPTYEEDPDFILNKIIAKVKQAKWVNKEKTFPIKERYPDIFNIVDKNGLDRNDKKYNYDKGWVGSDVLIANVIDREQMDWHRQNKHTGILAKSVNVDDNGNEWPEEGISWYAADTEFTQLFKYYKSWENYDVAITRTGDKSRAYIIDNATRNPEKVTGPAADLISNVDHLTDEEKSWERYDLDKLFRVTTATKIYNRLKNTIKRIDGTLGTDFLSELEAQVEEEKKTFDELYGRGEDDDTPTTTTYTEEYADDTPMVPEYTAEEPVKETKAPARRTATTRSASEPYKALAHWDTIPEALRGEITEVKDGTPDDPTLPDKAHFKDVTWNEKTYPISKLASCPYCGTLGPLELTSCPSCGKEFLD